MKRGDFMPVRDTRKKMGMAAVEVAKLLKISKGNYSKKENGIIKFSLEEAHTLSSYFGKSIEELFFKS